MDVGNDQNYLRCEEFFRLVSVKKPDYELALTNIVVQKDDDRIEEEFSMLGLRKRVRTESTDVTEQLNQVLFSLKKTPLKPGEVKDELFKMLPGINSA